MFFNFGQIESSIYTLQPAGTAERAFHCSHTPMALQPLLSRAAKWLCALLWATDLSDLTNKAGRRCLFFLCCWGPVIPKWFKNVTAELLPRGCFAGIFSCLFLGFSLSLCAFNCRETRCRKLKIAAAKKPTGDHTAPQGPANAKFLSTSP